MLGARNKTYTEACPTLLYSKVNLGLAFYGRAFTVSDTSCTTPGCTFESGGDAGPCSNSVGTLTNHEIEDIIAQYGLIPTLYQDAAVKTITWGDQWVGYDDVDTWALKINFAKSQCLGGVMVWAVSEESTNGTYADTMSSSTGYSSVNIKSVANGGGSAPLDLDHHSQCKWTNCGDDCPSGWICIDRSDTTPDHQEPNMTGSTHCDGAGNRKLCCPPGSFTICGWFDFNNGKYGGQFPTPGPNTPGEPGLGWTEVGSYSGACNNGQYQAACCNIAQENELYGLCRWTGTANSCSGTCGSDFGLVSSQGCSGGGECKQNTAREYCCTNQVQFQRWDNCAWYSTFGPIPKGRSSSYCRSGCPDSIGEGSNGFCSELCRQWSRCFLP